MLILRLKNKFSISYIYYINNNNENLSCSQINDMQVDFMEITIDGRLFMWYNSSRKERKRWKTSF